MNIYFEAVVHVTEANVDGVPQTIPVQPFQTFRAGALASDCWSKFQVTDVPGIGAEVGRVLDWDSQLWVGAQILRRCRWASGGN